MELRTASYVSEATGGEMSGGPGSVVIRRVVTDSRKAGAGDLFIALAGPRFDGHDHVVEAVRRGAVVVLVREGWEVPAGLGVVVVKVADTREALGRLATRHRCDLNPLVLAVGGSNGKTTTKELLATLCGEAWRTWASPASFNNDVGVPLTLLGLGSEHEVAVVEVGTNHPGELAPLLRMVVPRYGVITSLGREHLEFFGNLEGVVKEEGVLGEFLPAEGALFIAGDDAGVDEVVKRSKAPVVRVGLGVENEWRITNVKAGVTGTTFALESVRGDLSGSYSVGLVGRHQVRNVVMAMAVVAELGVSRELMERGLAKCRPVSRRMEVWVAGGVRVLDDSYNANVESMAAALGTLVELPCEGRRVAVLGDMAELGIAEESAHAEVGRCAASLGLDQLIAVGRLAGVMGAAAREAGMHRVMELGSGEAAAHAVPRLVRRGDLVLVKASRATGLECVSEALRKGDRGQG